MADTPISAHDPHPRRRADVGGVEMAYVDTGSPSAASGGAVVFLHGNPTSSYLWRNIIPHVSPLARCLAPDLMGMGESDATPRRLLPLRRPQPLPRRLVRCRAARRPGDAGGARLGFRPGLPLGAAPPGAGARAGLHGGYRRPVTWDEWPEAARQVFQGFRSEAGESMVLERNIFVERVLPGSTINGISDEAMAVYRRRYAEPGESRRPTLSWPREIPIEGEPPDVVALVAEYAEWLSQTPTPKLFVNAEPGAILTGPQREFCRAFPNQREVTVPGVHFVQEDSPDAIGAAIAEWYAGL